MECMRVCVCVQASAVPSAVTNRCFVTSGHYYQDRHADTAAPMTGSREAEKDTCLS